LILQEIGLEIEDPLRESRPGDFPCDIVGHALGESTHVIVVENQFGKTDHDHLGKFLTYAAMHAALTSIWICEIASDDHRKVIDWLNDNTPTTFQFYLAELEVIRIGDSAPAPQLRLVCKPNIKAKRQTTTQSQAEIDRHNRRRAMWTEILSYIKSKNPPFRVQSPGDDAWSTFRLGRGDFWFNLTLTPKRGCVGCELAFDPTWKMSAFSQLIADKSAIEAEIGKTLKWRDLPGRKVARIVLEEPIDPSDDNNLELIKLWMYEMAVLFFKTFQPRVMKLQQPAEIYSDDASESSEPDDEIEHNDNVITSNIAE